jgi:hypothetical protein
LGGESVIAAEEGADAIFGHTVFGIEAFGGVATATDPAGDLDPGFPSEVEDGVFGVAVGAGWGLMDSGEQGFAVDAGGDLCGFVLVATSACGEHMGAVHGRVG